MLRHIRKFLILTLLIGFWSVGASAASDIDPIDKWEHDGPFPMILKGRVAIGTSKGLPLSLRVNALKKKSEDGGTSNFLALGFAEFTVWPMGFTSNTGIYLVEQVFYSPKVSGLGGHNHYLTVIARSLRGDIIILDLNSSDNKLYRGKVHFFGRIDAKEGIFGQFSRSSYPVEMNVGT